MSRMSLHATIADCATAVDSRQLFRPIFGPTLRAAHRVGLLLSDARRSSHVVQLSFASGVRGLRFFRASSPRSRANRDTIIAKEGTFK